MTAEYVPTTDEIRWSVQHGSTITIDEFEAWLLLFQQQTIAKYLAEKDVPKVVLEFDPKVPIHGELLALRDARIRLEGKAEGWDEGLMAGYLRSPLGLSYEGSKNPYREALSG